jgi:hypothetical protein
VHISSHAIIIALRQKPVQPPFLPAKNAERQRVLASRSPARQPQSATLILDTHSNVTYNAFRDLGITKLSFWRI